MARVTASYPGLALHLIGRCVPKTKEAVALFDAIPRRPCEQFARPLATELESPEQAAVISSFR